MTSDQLFRTTVPGFRGVGAGVADRVEPAPVVRLHRQHPGRFRYVVDRSFAMTAMLSRSGWATNRRPFVPAARSTEALWRWRRVVTLLVVGLMASMMLEVAVIPDCSFGRPASYTVPSPPTSTSSGAASNDTFVPTPQGGQAAFFASSSDTMTSTGASTAKTERFPVASTR